MVDVLEKDKEYRLRPYVAVSALQQRSNSMSDAELLIGRHLTKETLTMTPGTLNYLVCHALHNSRDPLLARRCCDVACELLETLEPQDIPNATQLLEMAQQIGMVIVESTLADAGIVVHSGERDDEDIVGNDALDFVSVYFYGFY